MSTSFTPVDLVGRFSARELSYLWLAIENEKSILFVGSEPSGTTEISDALTMFIPETSSIDSLNSSNLSESAFSLSVEKELAYGDESLETTLPVSDGLDQALTKNSLGYLLYGELKQGDARHLFESLPNGPTAFCEVDMSYTTPTVSNAITHLTRSELYIKRESIPNIDIVCVQDNRYNQPHNYEIRELIEYRDDGVISTHPAFVRKPNKNEWHEAIGESFVLNEIQNSMSCNHQDIENELAKREKLLSYLSKNNITSPGKVALAREEYRAAPMQVVQAVEQDSLTLQ